jgi:hypothetical protein
MRCEGELLADENSEKRGVSSNHLLISCDPNMYIMIVV